eukprot:4591050-Pyramimonas_sp.AAC.1
MRPAPRVVSYHFGIESDLELELMERPARFDCIQLWASYALMRLKLKIQISPVMIRMLRTTRSVALQITIVAWRISTQHGTEQHNLGT